MKVGLKFEPTLNNELELELLLSNELQRAREKWKERLTTGPKWKRMLPAEYRDGSKAISRKQAVASEAGVSHWMTQKKLEVVRGCGVITDNVALCLEIGVGTWRGYGHVQAVLAHGLKPVFVDWLQEALDNAEHGLLKALGKPWRGAIKEMLQLGEATAVCESLDISTTRILIACTVLEHIGFGLSEGRRWPVVIRAIQNIGKLLQNPKNQVLIINTPPHSGKRQGSINLDDDAIFENLRVGAGRTIKKTSVDSHESATSRFSSMIVRADVF